jgi:ribosome-binding protein aMBF1 (putative translation factor)
MTKKFSELAEEAKSRWSPDAHAMYDAASVVFEAELAARADLGAMLARARAERHLTQPDLSAASGVQQSEISRIERGLGNPTATTLARLAAALGQRITLEPLK